MLSDEWLPRYRLLENFTIKWNGNGNGNAHGNGNGNGYNRGDYNSSFALRAVELKIGRSAKKFDWKMLKAGDLARREDNRVKGVKIGKTRQDRGISHVYLILQSLYFLNLKFQASSHLLWLYCPVCVRPGQKPKKDFLAMQLI